MAFKVNYVLLKIYFLEYVWILKELETVAQAGAPLQLLLKNPQGFEARKVLSLKHF